MLLPINLTLGMMQTKWKSILDPLLKFTIWGGQQIDGISLATNTPSTINHGLGRTPQGWFLVDNISNAVVWRTQSFNSLTLTLEASSGTTISIWVY